MLLYLILLIIIFLLYKFLIKPLISLRFYKNQGIDMHFVPITGYFVNEFANVEKHNDYYYSWKEAIKRTPKPKLLGGNYGSDAHLALFDPDLIKQFLFQHENYVKHPGLLSLFQDLCGGGLITAEGDAWKRRRKHLSKAFHYEFLREMTNEIFQNAKDMISSLSKKDLRGVKMLGEYQAMTGEITGRMFFGEAFSHERIEGYSFPHYFDKIATNVGQMILDPIFQTFGKLPGKLGLIKHHAETIKMIKTLRQHSYKLVQKMMGEAKKRRDERNHDKRVLIDLLYELRLQDPDEYLNDWEVVDEFVAMYLGGMDTTAHSLSMATYFLSRNQDIKAQATNEAKIFLEVKKIITLNEVNNMEYLWAVLRETLRMAAPTAIPFERVAVKDHKLGEYKIKKDTILVIANGVVGADPDFHENPEKYDPSRWTDPSSRTSKAMAKNNNIFTPFHGGPRNCIGQYFGQTAFKIILGLFLLNFEYKLSKDDYVLKMTQGFMYQPVEDPTYDLILKDV